MTFKSFPNLFIKYIKNFSVKFISVSWISLLVKYIWLCDTKVAVNVCPFDKPDIVICFKASITRVQLDKGTCFKEVILNFKKEYLFSKLTFFCSALCFRYWYCATSFNNPHLAFAQVVLPRSTTIKCSYSVLNIQAFLSAIAKNMFEIPPYFS